jgi:hypothetical protein
LTAGHIAALVRCSFVAEDDESRVNGILFFDETFSTESIHQTADNVMFKERHQPLIQPLHDQRYYGMADISR